MTVKIGVVGAGFIARYHAMQLRLIAEPNEIVAVHDLDPSRAAAFVAEEGGVVVDSVDEVIAASDAVVVCTWTATHLDVVRRVVAAGRPVFCEKPLGRDLAEASALVDVVERAGVANMVGLVLRTSPALAAVRSLVHDERSGAVMNVVFRDDQYLPTQGMYASTWRGERALAGSGTLLEHSIHDVDILEWLLGEVRTVAAQSSYAHGMDGIEDSVSVLLRFASGATGTLSSVWHDVLSRPSQRRMEIFCERALVTLEGDLFGPVRYQTTDQELVLDGDELVAWLDRRGVPLRTSEQDFVAAVRVLRDGGGVVPLSPGVRDALRAHELVDAIYRSAAADGAPVATGRQG
ncbi:MAG: Gfo/Idh/MocA family protein [Microthrixaceae bacterium]